MPLRSVSKVLVVEDDPATRELYRHALSNHGYSVDVVEDGLDALRRLELEVPDVVVLDLMLPRLNGEDVYHEMRAHPATREIPVVIVTGRNDVRHLELDPSGHFLRKPVAPDDLITAVERAGRTRQRRRKSPPDRRVV